MMCQADEESVPPPLLAGADRGSAESDAAATRWAGVSSAGPHACSMSTSQHHGATRTGMTLPSRDEWPAEHRDGFDLEKQFGADQPGDHECVGGRLFGIEIAVPDLPECRNVLYVGDERGRLHHITKGCPDAAQRPVQID